MSNSNTKKEIKRSVKQIREAIKRRPDLKYKCWPNTPFQLPDMHPMQGGCYIASQALVVLYPQAIPHHSGRVHFWVEIDGEIVDPTFDQFPEEYLQTLYSSGRKTRFKQISKRTKELLKEMGYRD